MKKYLFLGFICLTINAFAQLTTIKPRVESQSSREVIISKVDITDRETIVYMSYRLTPGINGGLNMDIFGRGLFFDGNPTVRNQISINPASFLVDTKTGKKFAYISAENIPEKPDFQEVIEGRTYRFSVSYQKLDEGIELVNLFEGNNSSRQRLQYWNFKGIEVNNPAEKSEKMIEQKLPDVRPKNAPQAAKPNNLLVKGKLLDAKTEKPISGKIVYRFQEQGIDSIQTDGLGNYSFTLLPNAYNYRVSAKGYLSTSEEIDLSKMKTGQFTQNIYLNPIETGETIPLENIKFEVSKATLLPESYEELDRLVLMMKENPSMTIRLEGHTDNVGDAAKNKSLSIDRVFGVRQYLIKKGIDGKRVQFIGYGDTKPVADNTTEAGRSQNRRVELMVLSH